MIVVGIMGTFKLDHLVEGSKLPTGGQFLVHAWYHNPARPGIINHEAQIFTDDPASEISEIAEVLGVQDVRKARSLRPGQQAVQRYGQGLREKVHLIHRVV